MSEMSEMNGIEESVNEPVRRKRPLDKFKSLVCDDDDEEGVSKRRAITTEPRMADGTRYDPPDSRHLARLHPLSFDSEVAYQDERHRYAVWKGREWATENVVSTTGLLKAAFPDKGDETFRQMAYGKTTGLLNRLNKFNPKFTQTFFNTEAGIARLKHRNALVREAITNPADEFYPHRSLLIHLLPSFQESETDYYDELALYFLKLDIIRWDPTNGRYVYPTSQIVYVPHILSVWKTTGDDGTKMHAAIEWYLNRENPYEVRTEHPDEGIDLELRDDMVRFRDWFHRPETRELYGIPYRTELNLHYAPLNIAGQADAIFYHPERDEFSVLDWKRCRNVEQCYDDFGLRYIQMGENEYEIVESVFDPRWRFAHEFGNSALEKYLCQVGCYAFKFEKLTGKIVTKKVLIVIEPRMCEVKTFEVVDRNENDAKVCAILNARERSLFRAPR